MTTLAQRVSDRIGHMLEPIDNATSDLGTLDKNQFLSDGKTQRAVIESIIVIGEAANKIIKLDPSIEQTNADLWQVLRDAYDMRIILTHEYFRVDPLIVWATVKNHLPQLEKLLQPFATAKGVTGDN